MRQIRRPLLLVPTLSPQGSGGKRRAEQTEQFNRDGLPPEDFPVHWTNPDVRGALYSMQGRVCAYCSADLTESGIDVDHFRPKGNVEEDAQHGGYWWLAYEFSNYFLSCTICNQKYKRDRFPLQDGAHRFGFKDRDRLREEMRQLLNPEEDSIEAWISLDWKKPAGRLIPNPQLPLPLAARVDEYLVFFRVNRKVAQRRKRAAIQRIVLEKISDQKIEEVREFAIRYRPHSIIAKQILEEVAPQFLPSPQEELKWLLTELMNDLVAKLEDLNELAGPSKIDENEAKELFWALAALWKDPPAGTSDDVKKFLESCGLREDVEQYFVRL